MNADQPTTEPAVPQRSGPPAALLVGAWLWVAIPFGYGLFELVQKIPALFSA